MKSSRLIIDDTLIISRLHYKELLEIKVDPDTGTQFLPLVTTSYLKPFLDNIPLVMGFTLSSVGNQTVAIKPERGYLAKDLEHALATANLRETLTMISTLNPAAPIFYQSALKCAIDDICDQKESIVATQKITFSMELMRVVHHLKVIKHVLIYLELYTEAQMASYILELYQDASDQISSLQTLAQTDLSIDDDFIENLAYGHKLITELHIALLSIETLKNKLSNTFFISLSMAASYGLSGPFMRANHHFMDSRYHAPRSIYQGLPPEKCLSEGGDGYARFVLRLLEIMASLKWLKGHVNNNPPILKPVVFLPMDAPIKKSFSEGEIEGCEGCIKINIYKNHHQELAFRIRSASYFIAQAIPHLMQLKKVQDLPLLLFSLGITADDIDL